MEHLKCETTTVEKLKLAFNNGHLWVCSSNEIKKCVFNNVFVKVLLCPICDSEERCLPCGWKFLSGDLYIIGGQLCGGLRVYIYLLMPCCPMPRPVCVLCTLCAYKLESTYIPLNWYLIGIIPSACPFENERTVKPEGKKDSWWCTFELKHWQCELHTQ